jgi:hypothetical protein
MAVVQIKKLKETRFNALQPLFWHLVAIGLENGV